MSSLEEKLTDWFLTTAEVLQRPIVELPVEELSDRLLDSFDGAALTSNLRDKAGVVSVRGFNREPGALGGLDADQAIAELFRVMDISLFDHHPLLRWYAVSGESAPQTIARVPSPVVATWQTREVRRVLRRFDVEHSLSIPLFVDGRAHQAVVISRPPGPDFSDDDLRLAASVQPMLSALQRQSEILAARQIPPHARDLLTGRELAVLRCMVRGMTARAAGAQLSSSPRTVEKHLQNAYRKLGVRDKVSAALVAREIGLVDAPLRTREGMTRQT